jgi:hypothetical protein
MALKCFLWEVRIVCSNTDANLKIQAVDFPTTYTPIFEMRCDMEDHVSSLG